MRVHQCPGATNLHLVHWFVGVCQPRGIACTTLKVFCAEREPDFITTLVQSRWKGGVVLNSVLSINPLLQDVIKFGPLLRTMAAQVVLEPLFVPKLMTHVGLAPLADWLLQVGALGVYSGLHFAAAPPLKYLCKSLNPKQQFQLKRTLEAWEYGSGNDYKL